MGFDPIISAVVCTYNRAALLSLALESLAIQSLPKSDYEVILVNDASTDDTAEICKEYAANNSQVRIIEQPVNLGLSAARNTGWKAAKGQYIAFLDDDAKAERRWLEKICAAFATGSPQLAVIGGPVRPLWEKPRPDWLPDEFLIWLTIYDLGPKKILSSQAALFAGANMSIPRRWLEETGGFDENLGRKKSNLLSREESAWWTIARAKQGICLYDPAIEVEHFTPAARLQQKWFRERLFWEGVSQRAETRKVSSPPRLKRTLTAMNYFYVVLLSKYSLQTAFLPWRWSRSLKWQCYLSFHWGMTVGLLGSSRK